MNIGVLGGGQLGRMLALAGYPLGMTLRFLDPSPGVPAGQVAHRIAGRYDDEAALERFAADLDVVTYEFENVPVETVRRLAQQVSVFPPPEALEAAQDRLLEKSLFQDLAIPVPPFSALPDLSDLERTLTQIGYPAVLKTRRFGYDGKGQWMLQNPDDLVQIKKNLEKNTNSLILEGFVRFDRELSLIAARGLSGDIIFYPLVQNTHKDGILRLSLAPAPAVTAPVQQQAESYMRRVLEELDYVGILTIEFFQCGEELLANEMAPRVHNSGHWTIEGADVSQFENHLRAISGLPLGPGTLRGNSAMWNILGTPPDPRQILSVQGAHLHLYGKAPRPGRKIGHITLCANNEVVLSERIEQIRILAPQT